MATGNGEYAAWVAIDWADREHVITLQEEGSEEREQLELRQEAGALRGWLRRLRKRFGGRPVALIVEQSRGGLVHALLDYEFVVLYPLNPKALARYREARRLGGAKDDPHDSQLLLDFLRAHHEQLRAWHPEDPETRTLRQLVRYRGKLAGEGTRLSNQLTGLLKEYFPQLLEWFGKAGCPALWDFLERWPTLQSAQRTRRGTLERFFGRLGRRGRPELAETVRQAEPLTRDPAVLEVFPLMACQTAQRLRQLREQVAELDRQIGQRFGQLPDHEIFLSLPGAGPVLAPRLLAAFGQDRGRFDAVAMQCFSGTAPVTVCSGQRRVVRMRRARPHFLHQSFHQFAELSIRYSTWARAFYGRQREKGRGHHTAVRALANRWVRIITACWNRRVPYSEDYYLSVLRKRKSPVVQWIYRSKLGEDSA